MVVSLPVVWMTMSSLKSNVEIHSFPMSFLPQKPMWSNYAEVLVYGMAYGGAAAKPAPVPGALGLGSLWPRYFLNTSIIAVFVMVGTLFTNALVAFSFAWLRWRWRNTAFFIVIATMMIPGQVTMIPTYLVFTKVFHWHQYLVPADRAGVLRLSLGHLLAASVHDDDPYRDR